MFHIALTPNENPANALSAQHETLMGAFAKLLHSLDLALGSDVLGRVLEATKEAIDNMEDEQPSKGTWTDMGCEDDAFSIDIFCSDDARYVRFDDNYLLAPHGAVALGIGRHNHQQWIYDESEVKDWENVLRPIWHDYEEGLHDAVESVVNPVVEQSPIATITEVIRDIKHGDCTLSAIFSDGSERKLFNFYIDELSFSDFELIGKTETEAQELHRERDANYLRS